MPAQLSRTNNPGKDHPELRGYRITTLPNTFGKVIDKIVALRLSHDLEVEINYWRLQGYRLGRDTEINSSVLACDIYESFQRKNEMVVAVIDLE